ncbi:MAG TPA: proton-conducting transporter membrane subunit [Anaerolineales bacterium]|nr:proton-conducting transporter membrane subunit [Anaerolineales bacterium]
MSAPVLWIAFPAVLGVILLFLRMRVTLVAVLGTLATLSLALSAWFLPDREQFTLGPWTVPFSDTLNLLGRSFTLDPADRSVVALIFLMAALWFGAVPVARTGHNFIPLALGMISLFTAAIAVEPFLYAALLIEIGVLLSIPMLIEPGRRAGRGIMRYLTFQTLGMPFILLTGWMLEGVETSPVEASFVVRLTLLLGLGFGLLLAIFPFYTWLPLLAEEAHPYVASFVFLLLPGAIFVLVLGFLDEYAWLREVPEISTAFRWAGILMIITSGLWSMFQRQLARILAYALILEIGFSFLALNLALSERTALYLGLFFALQVPRGLSLGVWSLALSVLRQEAPELQFHHIQGLGMRFPITAGSLVLANLTLAGLPLLAGFPLRWSLLDGLASSDPGAAGWALVGSLGLLIAGLRTLMVLLASDQVPAWFLSESLWQRSFLLMGAAALLILGLFPQWLLPLLVDLPAAFQQLAP